MSMISNEFLNKARISAFLLFFGVSLFATGCTKISRFINPGGIIFTIEIETDEPNKEEIFAKAARVIQNRIYAMRFDGEVARDAERPDRISVKIYGSHDWEKMKRFLFVTYRLEVKKAVSPPHPASPQTFKTKEEAEKILAADQEVLPYKENYYPDHNFVIVEKKPIINGDDIRSAEAFSRTNSALDYSISFSLNKQGGEKFGDWTARNIGNYMAVVLDGEVLSVAFIKSQITDVGEITGSFTKATAEELSLNLRSGYLPAKLRVIEEKKFED